MVPISVPKKNRNFSNVNRRRDSFEQSMEHSVPRCCLLMMSLAGDWFTLLIHQNHAAQSVAWSRPIDGNNNALPLELEEVE